MVILLKYSSKLFREILLVVGFDQNIMNKDEWVLPENKKRRVERALREDHNGITGLRDKIIAMIDLKVQQAKSPEQIK